MKNVVCVKHGDKYNHEYVNKLYSMVNRYATGKFKFYCLTDNSENIDDHIEIIKLPENNILDKWWNKMLALDHFTEGETILFDLDVIIHGSLKQLFDYKTMNLNVLYAYWKNPEFGNEVGNTLFNSSVMKWTNAQGKLISDVFFKEPKRIMYDYKGIDRFMWNENVEVDTLPNTIAYSYINNGSQMNHNKPLCIFNESLKQHELNDKWIYQYWN